MYDIYEKYRILFTEIFFILNIINLILFHSITQFIVVIILLLAFHQIAYYFDEYYINYCKNTRRLVWVTIILNIVLLIGLN